MSSVKVNEKATPAPKEAAGEEPPSRQARAAWRSRLLRKETLFVLAGIVMALAGGLAVFRLTASDGGTEPAPGVVPAVPPAAAQADVLDVEEYLKLAEGAVVAREYERAVSFLEEGLARTNPHEHLLRSRFFTLLGRVSHRMERPLHERIYMENGDRLRLRAEKAVVLFEDALRAYGEGRLDEARQLCSRFLLRQGELQADQRAQLVPRATRLLGEAAYAAWSDGPVEDDEVIAEPEFDFGEDG